MSRQSKLPPLEKPTPEPEHLRPITKKELRIERASYLEGLHPNETKSCVIWLKDIQFLIDYYSKNEHLNNEKPIDGFRFYFYRPKAGKKFPSTNQEILDAGGKGQLSIIMVPIHNAETSFKLNKEIATTYADDMFNEEEECYVAWPGGEGTGLCPMNCGGSQGDGNG